MKIDNLAKFFGWMKPTRDENKTSCYATFRSSGIEVALERYFFTPEGREAWNKIARVKGTKKSEIGSMINWQPMDTAPTDGTEVLTYSEYRGFPIISLAFFEDEAWHIYSADSLPTLPGGSYGELTHWAPYNPPQDASGR